MEAEILKIRVVYTCPECGSRYWLVIQNGQDEPFCECSECGWFDHETKWTSEKLDKLVEIIKES